MAENWWGYLDEREYRKRKANEFRDGAMERLREEERKSMETYHKAKLAASQEEYNRYIASGAEEFGNVRPAGLPGFERVLGPELSRPEYLLSAPVGGLGVGIGGLLGMRGGELLGEKANLPMPAKVGLEVAGGLAGGFAGGAVERGITAGIGAIAKTPAGQRFATRALQTVSEEAGGLKPRVPEEPITPEAARFKAKAMEGMAPEAPVRGPTREEAMAGWRRGVEGGKPPTEPPTVAEAVPTEPPEKKLVAYIEEVRKLLPERAEALHQHRVEQVAGMAPIWSRQAAGEITAEEAHMLSRASLAGEVEFPELQRLGEMLTEDDMHGLRQVIPQRARDAGLGFYDIDNALDALTQLKETGQLAPNQVTLLSKIFPGDVAEQIAKLTPQKGRLLGELWEIAGIPRAIQASTDVSFPLRQGVMVVPRHPLVWGRGTLESFRAVLQPGRAMELNMQIVREQADGILSKTLDITLPGTAKPFAERPEGFISKYLGKIPIVGPVLRRSEISFATGGNIMRRDLNLNYINRWSNHVGRALTEAEMDMAGHIPNYLTGRGPVPKKLAYTLGQILYSPRFFTSGPAFVARLLDPRISNYLRYMMAQEFVSFVGTGIGLLSALKFSGLADVEVNPLSSDWGKIKIGKTRFDIWGGKQQLARYTAQMIMGERKTIGTGDMVDASRKDILMQFASGKLSPAAGMAYDIWRGRTYQGEELTATGATAKTQTYNRMAPLAVQDLVDAVRTEGAGGLIALPSFLGVGVMTFETPGEKIMKIAKERYGADWTKLGSVERARLEDKDSDIAAARQEQRQTAANWGNKESLELKQEDADFEANFTKYLQQPGLNWQSAVKQYQDYVAERAVKNEVRWRDTPDRDPRSPLERKMDQYDALEFPEWGTQEEKDAWYEEKAAMRAADPELDASLRDRQLLRFKDPTMRSFITQYQDALAVREQYYSIPPYLGISLEDGRQINQILAEASVRVTYGFAPDRTTAVYEIMKAGGYPMKLLGYAMEADKLRNPERRNFRLQHPELAMFENLPITEEFTEGGQVYPEATTGGQPSIPPSIASGSRGSFGLANVPSIVR